MKNCILHGDLLTGHGEYSTSAYEMSSSIQVGKISTWLASKTHEGLVVYQAYGDNNTKHGEMRKCGVSVVTE